ncbi:MAG: YbjN domain-containing protein [Clostridiales bacterium]|nr:YbjN domain-containing protein [Clostridiales bacterium]
MADCSFAIANAVRDYLNSQEWNFDYKAEKNYFRMGMNLKSKLKSCEVVIRIREDSFTVYAISPISADDNTKSAVAEYITRANYGLKVGNFEMDYSDGEVRYKCHHECGDNAPAQDVVESNVDLSFLMMQRYGDGLLAVIFGVATPEVACQQAEAPRE